MDYSLKQSDVLTFHRAGHSREQDLPIPTSPNLPSISHPCTFSPSILLSKSPLPSRNTLFQQSHLKVFALPDLRRRRSCCSHPLPSAALFLAAADDWTHPFVLLLHEEKKPVFSRMFKKSSQTHIVLIQKKQKKKSNNNKCSLHIDKKLFLCLPGYLLMEEHDVLYIFTPPKETQGNFSQIHDTTSWEGAKSSVTDQTWIHFWERGQMVYAALRWAWGTVEMV